MCISTLIFMQVRDPGFLKNKGVRNCRFRVSIWPWVAKQKSVNICFRNIWLQGAVGNHSSPKGSPQRENRAAHKGKIGQPTKGK